MTNNNLDNLINADKDYYETLEIKVNTSTMIVCRGLFHNVFKRHSCESMQDPYDLMIGYDDYLVPEKTAKKMVSCLMLYAMNKDMSLFNFILNDKEIVSFYILLDKYDICKVILTKYREKVKKQILEDYNMYVILAYGYGYGEIEYQSPYISTYVVKLLGALDITNWFSVNGLNINSSKIIAPPFSTYSPYKAGVKIVRKIAELSHMFKKEAGDDYKMMVNKVVNDANYLNALISGFKEVKEISAEAFKHYVFMTNINTERLDISISQCENIMSRFTKYDGVVCKFAPFTYRDINPIYTKQ